MEEDFKTGQLVYYWNRITAPKIFVIVEQFESFGTRLHAYKNENGEVMSGFYCYPVNVSGYFALKNDMEIQAAMILADMKELEEPEK